MATSFVVNHRASRSAERPESVNDPSLVEAQTRRHYAMLRSCHNRLRLCRLRGCVSVALVSRARSFGLRGRAKTRFGVVGMSVRSAARTAGVTKNTVLRLLVRVGKVCSDYQDRTLCDLPCRRIEVDEIWPFVYAKWANTESIKMKVQHAGDVWTWTTLCADSRAILSYRVGDRSFDTAINFMRDLKSRLDRRRVQLTSDGLAAYAELVNVVDLLRLVFLPGEGFVAPVERDADDDGVGEQMSEPVDCGIASLIVPHIPSWKRNMPSVRQMSKDPTSGSGEGGFEIYC